MGFRTYFQDYATKVQLILVQKEDVFENILSFFCISKQFFETLTFILIFSNIKAYYKKQALSAHAAFDVLLNKTYLYI